MNSYSTCKTQMKTRKTRSGASKNEIIHIGPDMSHVTFVSRIESRDPSFLPLGRNKQKTLLTYSMYMEYLPIHLPYISVNLKVQTSNSHGAIWDLFLPTSSKVTCKVAVRQELMNLLAISAERQAWQGDDGVSRFTGGMRVEAVFLKICRLTSWVFRGLGL